MRTLSSGIDGQLETSGAFAGWAIEFALTNGQFVRVTSIDTGFEFDSMIFAAVDMSLPSLSWDGSILKPGRVVLGDADVTFWTLAVDLLLADAAVRIWAVYDDASGEAEQVWSGRAGQVTRNATDLSVEISLSNLSDTQTSPRKQMQELVNPIFLIPGGSVLNVSGQRWTLYSRALARHNMFQTVFGE